MNLSLAYVDDGKSKLISALLMPRVRAASASEVRDMHRPVRITCQQWYDSGLIAAGAGKSSVVSALLRLTEIEAGQIRIDGCDIRGVHLRRLRSAIGVVPQSAFLFQVPQT